MTGFKSKKTAALDEEGMYLVHHTAQEPMQKLWDTPSEKFNNWWNAEYDDSANPFEIDTFAYWAWAGWQEALAQPTSSDYALGYAAGFNDACKKPAQNHSEDNLTWVDLTDESITQAIDLMPNGINGWMSDWDLYEFARAIEQSLKEKNT